MESMTKRADTGTPTVRTSWKPSATRSAPTHRVARRTCAPRSSTSRASIASNRARSTCQPLPHVEKMKGFSWSWGAPQAAAEAYTGKEEDATKVPHSSGLTGSPGSRGAPDRGHRQQGRPGVQGERGVEEELPREQGHCSSHSQQERAVLAPPTRPEGQCSECPEQGRRGQGQSPDGRQLGTAPQESHETSIDREANRALGKGGNGERWQERQGGAVLAPG
jgi:hypothetical protein